MNEQNHNVLVVEDEEAARSMLALSLKLAGYNVHTASDVVEALGEMKQRQFDVVVTDYTDAGHGRVTILVALQNPLAQYGYCDALRRSV